MLLETARLRCEALLQRIGSDQQLLDIHREIGMAGYETCTDFEAPLRQDCLGMALARLDGDRVRAPGRGPLANNTVPSLSRTLAAMFSDTIAASDALAGELADRSAEDDDRDRLHLVHGHVMAACELLDERLTVLELHGAGIEA